MADVGASDAVKMIRGLQFHGKKINKRVDKVMSLLSDLRTTNRILNSSHRMNWLFFFIYDANLTEDVLETFVVDVAVMLQKKETGFIKRFIGEIFPEEKYGFVLRNIKKSIPKFHHEFFKLFPNICYEPRVANQGQRRLRQTYPRGIEEHFVGRDDELEKLVSLVVEKKNRVISIWGVAGLGKTTMARKIYKQEKVRINFNAFAWVHFCQGCQISDCLLNILMQLTPREANKTTGKEEVIYMLKEVQRWSHCLIVLDNIQDMEQWRQLSPALEMEGGRSVILLTTREENLAKKGSPHKLRLLNEDEAWELLKGHAFPGKDGPDIGLFPRLGKEMVHKCGYLPSAISRLGTILSSKNSLDDWQVIKENVSEYIQVHQIEGDEQLASSLDSSYANLPYYLQQCFLYLRNFSKDEEIDVEDLYFLWIAEGMVTSVNEVRKKKTPDLANEDREETTHDIANEDSEEITLDIPREEETTQYIAYEGKEEITLDLANEEEMILDLANEDREETTQDIANEDREEITNEEKMTQYIAYEANEDSEEPALEKAEKYLAVLASRGMVSLQRDELSATRRFQSYFLKSYARELTLWEQEKIVLLQNFIDFCVEMSRC